VTGSARMLPSGAGHDAAILAPLVPVAMLFVRCREGLSHHPDEFVSLQDIGVALQVTVEFLRSWEGI
jgi:allantoate deiminase